MYIYIYGRESDVLILFPVSAIQRVSKETYYRGKRDLVNVLRAAMQRIRFRVYGVGFVVLGCSV